jgi:hypothetical protein
VIRQCRFTDVATRGVLAGESHELVFERNIFVRVGDDTASGDIAAGSACSAHVIRGNLFAGNVDGVVHHAAGSGHLIEHNLFVFGKWENNIDLKFHWQRGDEDPWSTIRGNVIYAHEARYSGVELQDSSDNIRVVGNVIRGARVYGLQIRGRSGPLQNLEIIGNWFDAAGDGVGINLRVQSQDPGDVTGVWVLHNIFQGYTSRAARLNHGEEVFVYNNIFTACDPGASVPVSAGTNLYDGVDAWAEDVEPIVGTPIYAEEPVGPLEDGSPGKGEATILAGHDWGPDVGLPGDFTGMGELEADILRALAEVFTEDEIREAMEQGGLEYDPGQVDPDGGDAAPDSGRLDGADGADASLDGGDAGVDAEDAGDEADGLDALGDDVSGEDSGDAGDPGDRDAGAEPADEAEPVSGSCGGCASQGGGAPLVAWWLLFLLISGSGTRLRRRGRLHGHRRRRTSGRGRTGGSGR